MFECVVQQLVVSSSKGTDLTDALIVLVEGFYTEFESLNHSFSVLCLTLYSALCSCCTAREVTWCLMTGSKNMKANLFNESLNSMLISDISPSVDCVKRSQSPLRVSLLISHITHIRVSPALIPAVLSVCLCVTRLTWSVRWSERAGWPSITSASWREERRSTGSCWPPRACPGSKMTRWAPLALWDAFIHQESVWCWNASL